MSEADIPEGADFIDFPVLITLLDHFDGGRDVMLIARYVPVSLENGELKIHVHIYGPLYLHLDSWFSIEVLEPGIPVDNPE